MAIIEFKKNKNKNNQSFFHFSSNEGFSVPSFESILEKEDVGSSSHSSSHSSSDERFSVSSFESVIEIEDVVLVESSINGFPQILLDSLRFRLEEERKGC